MEVRARVLKALKSQLQSPKALYMEVMRDEVDVEVRARLP